VVETHVSWLVFLGERAFKVKKPVRFAFLDFSTPEARREACHREVQLNRRLSPDVYLGVLDVVGSDGQAVDHVVEMRRMPPARRLSTLARAGDPDAEAEVRKVAHRVAAFHSTALRGPSIDRDASHASVTAAWARDLEEMAPLARGPGAVLPGGTLDEVGRLAGGWLEGRAAVFADRIAGGHVVDGHGDLLADDIFCLDDGPRILDCIEFDDRLRHVDVWDDVAFLMMDLERLGRADLARLLRDTYLELSADPPPSALVEVFVAHRALVRSKVAALRAVQAAEISGLAEREASVGEARARLEQCRDHLRRARVRLVVVGGLPGTGKTTVASALAEHLDATLLSSDPTRKELAGLPAHVPAGAPFGEGLYSEGSTEATYDLLLDRAAVVLARGGTVVLDASWTSEAHRRSARATAARCGADVVELRCACPPEVAEERIERRRAGGPTASDADAAVARRMAERADPWPEAAVVDTSGDPAATSAAAVVAVERTPTP
jgi:aminoglycoside phosphotransferase family enzyme/predicted kinase